MRDEGTCLWTLKRDARQVACVVRLMADRIEIDIAYDGDPVITRAFETGEEALQWAEQTRVDRQARGWN